MKFLDEVKIFLKSGNGGPGAVSFRREANVPYGGPDGGDGGKGADVIVECVEGLNTLIDFRYKQHFKAETGHSGAGRNKSGQNGQPVIIKLPLGTQILSEEKDQLLLDLVKIGQREILLDGGKGGKGNAWFKSSTRQSPRYAQPGITGEELWVWFRLKLIADAGLIGLPNAGKSTLLNTLAKENIAITSEIPGTTRDLVRAQVDVGGVLIEFVDTAGVRPDPENTIEREGINRSQEVIGKSNLSLLVQDVTDQKGFDVELGSFISVMNKSDLLFEQTPNKSDVVYLSCTTGNGVKELLKAIQSKLGIDEGAETAFLSRKRHEICLKEGQALIEDSIVSLNEGRSLELVAESLRSAHQVLGEILRPMTADDLLGEIFSEFCIGK